MKMKNLNSEKIPFLILVLVFWFMIPFYSCKEVGPDINLEPEDLTLIDTTYLEDVPETPQQKVVLIEDFTGQECVNCPKAHDSITSLIETYPGQIAAIALYNYLQDIDEGLPLVTDDAQDVGNYLGPISGWPAGVIDRKDFDVDGALPVLYTLYETYAEEQLLLTPTCNIYLDYEYLAADNKLIITVTVKYTSDVILENNLSVALCEDSIIAFQITPGGLVEDYEQNHVLRDLLTPSLGISLPAHETGRVYQKQFSVIPEPDWVFEHLVVVAFVHNFTDVNKEVQQAALLEID